MDVLICFIIEISIVLLVSSVIIFVIIIVLKNLLIDLCGDVVCVIFWLWFSFFMLFLILFMFVIFFGMLFDFVVIDYFVVKWVLGLSLFGVFCVVMGMVF